MNNRVFLCCIVGLLWIGGCGNERPIENPVSSGNSPSQMVVAAAEKTNVCHFDETGGSKVVQVNNNALPRLLENGDCVTAAPKGTAPCSCLPAAIVSFSATPDLIDLNNRETSTLAWTTTDANECSIDNGVGSVPCSGSTVVNPSATTTYTLTATGFVGTPDTSQTALTIQYCFPILPMQGACPSGITKYCEPVPIDRFNKTHAQNACTACSGAPCQDASDFRFNGKALVDQVAINWYWYVDATEDPDCGPGPGCISPFASAGSITPACGCSVDLFWAP
jgi:hypothetical protein